MKTLISILAISLLVSCYSSEPDKTGHEGEILPSFKLLKMDSASYLDTKEILVGKPFVVFYFGPHCPYSKAQMTEILEDMEKFKKIQFYIISPWPFPEIKSFYKQYQLYNYSNITVGYDFKRVFTDYLEIQGVPYLAVYDKNKKLKEAFAGKIYSKQLKRAIED